MPTQSAQALLSSLIDYAGLFPPAKLEMKPAVEAFGSYVRSEQEWMLGAFICPASKLEDFSREASSLMPGTVATSGYREHAIGEPWRLSVLIDGDPDEDLDDIEAFNEHHSVEEHGLCQVDSIEIKAPSVEVIDAALDMIPETLSPYFEIPLTEDPRGFIAALAGNEAAAKIRTGGITPDAFPTTDQIAAFLVAAAAADVPFKATAGLHHPFRGDNKLTYAHDSASCTMHGFLNLFLAAAAAKVRRADVALVAKILDAKARDTFAFSDQGVRMFDFAIDTIHIASVRETFALSFGSCSFEEPVKELTAARIL